MKKILQAVIKKYYVLPFLFLVLFLSAAPMTMVYAQSNGVSVSGDEICGSTASSSCTLADLKTITSNLMNIVIGLGLPLLVVFITYRFVMAWFALQQGKAGAYKDALKASRDAVIGFLFIVAMFGGFFLIVLKYLGVNGKLLEGVKLLNDNSSFVEHTYAAGPPLAKGKCPAQPEGYSCITDSGDNGFCINDGYNPSCQKLSTSAVIVPKGNCGGKGTGQLCIADNDKGGACFSDRCVLLLENPPAPVVVGDLNIYTCSDGSKVEKPALCPKATTNQAPATNNVQASPTDACGSAFNMTGVCSLYDFMLAILRLIMRFFIYPALVTIWVWTGFAFVYAQGNPEGLNKAKKWLMWAFVTTLVIFLLQAFLTAARGTVQKILPANKTTQSAPK